MNKKFFLSVLLIAVLALSSCGSTPQPPTIPEQTEYSPTLLVNKEFTAEDGFKYTVVGARATTKSLFNPTPKDDYDEVYFIVTVQLENGSDSMQTINSQRNFELRDSNGQAMKQAFDANNYNQPDYWEGNTVSDKKGINKDAKVKGEIAYTVPADGESFTFVIKDNSGKELFSVPFSMPVLDENISATNQPSDAPSTVSPENTSTAQSDTNPTADTDGQN